MRPRRRSRRARRRRGRPAASTWPGEEAEEHDADVVVPRARMVMDGGREALDVVAEQEDVHEGPALGPVDEDIPGRGYEKEEEDADGGEQPAQQAPLPRGQDVAG